MVRINIGGFELDSDKLPQQGLDYSNFDYETRKALSVFDTDSKKGHLSVAELRNAISFFSSQDGATETGKNADGNKSVTYHKKDGNIDNFEYQKTEEKFNNKTANIKPQTREVAKVYQQKHVSEFIEFYSDYFNKLPSDEEINAFKKAWAALVDNEINGTNPGDVLHEIKVSAYNNTLATNSDGIVAVEFARRKVHNIVGQFLKMKNDNLKAKLDNNQKELDMKVAIEAINSAIEAEKKGLRVSDSDPDVFQDKNGKYYIRKPDGKLQRCDKEGNYNVRKTLNDKGQKALTKYNKDGVPISVKAQNYQNKTYTNRDFAAKVLNSSYYVPIHRWNEKEHCFELFEKQ